MPCIKETVFKYQILAIHFSLSGSAGARSKEFSAGQGIAAAKQMGPEKSYG